tara:strand:+ start:8588 stop:9295 length:708 start_codon:yes stop_codon:yes gene_type:complete
MNDSMVVSKSKKILIIGGTNGIGYALSKHFSEKNYFVFSVGRTLKLPRIRNTKYFFFDLFSKKKLDVFLQKIKKNRFDLVIHCIGGSLGLKKLDYSSCNDLWYLNCGIIIYINKYLIDNQLLKPSSNIILFSSKSSKNLIGSSPYILSKIYLENYAKLLSKEIEKNKIYVSSIKLGIVALPNNNWHKCKINNLKKYKANIKLHNNNKEISSIKIFKKIFKILMTKKLMTGKVYNI